MLPNVLQLCWEDNTCTDLPRRVVALLGRRAIAPLCIPEVNTVCVGGCCSVALFLSWQGLCNLHKRLTNAVWCTVVLKQARLACDA
jgi:hypothetical protein